MLYDQSVSVLLTRDDKSINLSFDYLIDSGTGPSYLMVWIGSYGTLSILTIDVLQHLICFYITSCSKNKQQGSLNHYSELMVLVIRFTLDMSILILHNTYSLSLIYG